jgi:hypothetical protein
MRSQDIREFLKKQPFQPLRLTLTDGTAYEVRHPDLLMVGRSTVVVGIPAADEPDAVFDRAIHVDLLHIMQVEPLKSPTTPTSN